MKTRVLALLVVGATALPLASRAADVRPVIVAGIDTGGDKIFVGQLTNGDTQTIRANEGIYLGGGVSVINDDKNIEFLGTINYKYQAVHADNGDVTWTRVPIDALVFYRWEKFRLGGGVTYHTNNKLNCSGQAPCVSVNVDNALGGVIQGDFLLGKFNIGLRYTSINYKSNNGNNGSAKGNGVGVEIGITF